MALRQVEDLRAVFLQEGVAHQAQSSKNRPPGTPRRPSSGILITGS
jgi:hypothetical protein